MDFAQKLLAIRKERGLTQTELAAKIGITHIYISKWESGKGHPSLSAFARLCQALRISADYLLFDNVPPEGPSSIDDFELYESFRKTEKLPPEKKAAIKDHVDALVFKEKLRAIPEAGYPQPPRRKRKA
jgi:transcriptional regulator with XRE-family HTH domain